MTTPRDPLDPSSTSDPCHHSPGTTATTTTAADAPHPNRGRPSGCTVEKVRAICAFIRITGVSDTLAGALAGVGKSSVSRWKQEDEEVEMLFTQARAQYQVPRLAQIAGTTCKDGSLDWRAQAWLIKFSAPDEHGRPSPRRRLRDVEVSEEEKQQMAAAAHEAQLVTGNQQWEVWRSGEPMTPEMTVALQHARTQQLARMQAEEEEYERYVREEAGGDLECGSSLPLCPGETFVNLDSSRVGVLTKREQAPALQSAPAGAEEAGSPAIAAPESADCGVPASERAAFQARLERARACNPRHRRRAEVLARGRARAAARAEESARAGEPVKNVTNPPEIPPFAN